MNATETWHPPRHAFQILLVRRAGFALERRLFEKHHEQVKEDTTSAPASIRVDRNAMLSSMRISSTATYDVDLPGLQTPDARVVIRETRQEQILDPVALLKTPRPSSIVISVEYAGRTSTDRLGDQFLSNTQFTKNRDEVYRERKPFRGTLRGELRSMNSLFQHETRVSQFRIVETVQAAGRVPYDQTSTMYPESFAVNYATKCNFFSQRFIFTLLTYCSGIY